MFNINEFRNPSSIWRGAPFWAWNDRMEEKEIRRQIQGFKKVGLGGYFMHSRVGLVTEYMGKDWMKAIKAGISEGKKQKMFAHLYDEDRWPSGFAGGAVTKKNPEYSNCYLVRTEKPLDVPGATLLKKEAGFYYYQKKAPQGNADYNGYSYIDLLDSRATDAFIREAYEPYKREIGKEFGKTVPSIFTDEPNLGTGQCTKDWYPFNMPWTPLFPVKFKAKYGYDIMKNLHLLFESKNNYRKIRHDFFRLLSNIYTENFSKKIGSWCAKNGINFTGHFNGEDTFTGQIYTIAAAMPHYQYQQWPGVDHLGWHIGRPPRKDYGWYPTEMHMTMKQVSSVAHQFRKERVLSELYGVSGWDLTFEGQKWIGDWEYALGINLRCQHLTLYSLRGTRKRDYPASINYQSAWFKYYRKSEDYFGRLSYLMTRGDFRADILLLHPLSSGWCVYDGRYHSDGEYKIDRLGVYEKFVQLSKRLSGLHRDYDYGDESIMEKNSRVSKGLLHVAKSSYKVVVVPPSLSWFKSTITLLRKFASAGGKIIVIKPVPVLVEGKESGEFKKLLKMPGVYVINNNKEELEAALDTVLLRDVSIIENGKEAEDIYCQHRTEGKKHLFFLCNISLKKTVKCSFKPGIYMSVKELDLETGEIKDACSTEYEFAPTQSRMFLVDEAELPSHVTMQELKPKEEINIPGKLNFRRLDENALTLDKCSYRINNTPWSKVMPVWKAQVQLRESFGYADGIKQKNGGMIPFWITYKNAYKNEGVKFFLKFEFNVSVKPKDIRLAVETIRNFDIEVNGKKLDAQKARGWWIDRAIHTLDIKSAVKTGRNTVILSMYSRFDCELEDIYIIGDFGVFGRDNKSFTIGKEPKTLASGDWAGQGYKFFGGEMEYEFDFNFKGGKKAVLDISGTDAVCSRVNVNGKDAGIIGWRPMAIDITKHMKKGSNKVKIGVVASRRNTMGPLHYEDKEPNPWIGPGLFSADKWSEKYIFVKYGLGEKTKIVIYK